MHFPIVARWWQHFLHFEWPTPGNFLASVWWKLFQLREKRSSSARGQTRKLNVVCPTSFLPFAKLDSPRVIFAHCTWRFSAQFRQSRSLPRTCTKLSWRLPPWQFSLHSNRLSPHVLVYEPDSIVKYKIMLAISDKKYLEYTENWTYCINHTDYFTDYFFPNDIPYFACFPSRICFFMILSLAPVYT